MDAAEKKVLSRYAMWSLKENKTNDHKEILLCAGCDAMCSGCGCGS